jgi:hypothetical protein
MTSSPQDRQLGHSLWLQRRSTHRAARRVQWRSDRTPVNLVLLLLGLLILLWIFLPTDGVVQRLKQAAPDDTSGGPQGRSVVGVLTEP